MDSVFSTKGLKPGHWLTCIHCCSYFQAKDLRYTPELKSHQTCPNCPISGLNFDIFRTNKPRRPRDPNLTLVKNS